MSSSLNVEMQPLRWLLMVAAGVTVITLSVLFAKIFSTDGSIALPHANCNENPLPHIVYEIYVVYPDGVYDILKYGISSQTDFVTKDGNPRPEYQIPLIKKIPRYKKCTIGYNILHRNIPGRIAAKTIEQSLVDVYYSAKNRQPDLQKLPIPSQIKKLLK